MKIDDIREYIVIVNGGSGCIFQPEDDSYSYILTAKHNLVNSNNEIEITELTRFEFQDKKWLPVTIDLFTDNACCFLHEYKDIAIIKIAKIAGLDNMLRYDDFEDDRTGYILCGYPATRRDMPNQYRCDENVAILGTSVNQLREAQIPGNPTIDEVKGHSGGAIIKMKDNYLLLTGIQNKMVSATKEYLGRVEFTPLASFDEIVDLFSDELSPLLPSHCKSFKYLKNQVMKLEGCFCDIKYTKRFLQDITDDISNNPLTPQMIKNHLKERLLMKEENESSLNNKGLWIAWLEMLIILKVVGLNPTSEQELNNVFNQYRIIYSSSKDDWSNLIQDILRSDYKGLNENACIIVANETKPSKWVIGKGLIQNIAQQIPKNEMNIDVGVSPSLHNFKHVHLYAFQRDCIVDKEEEYIRFNNSNEEELLLKLKQEYENIFNNN
jgi:hypothetical protein